MRVIDGEVYDAQKEAHKIRAEARAQGLQEGREAALAQLTAELAAAAKAERSRTEAAEPALIKLAVKIAEKILARQLTLTPDAVVEVARAALGAARSRHTITLRVHPDDISAMEAGRPRLREALAANRDVSIRADHAIPRGGCVIETEMGRLDARLETQLAAIERALVPA